MATVVVPLWPGPIILPNVNAARVVWVPGTNFPDEVLRFSGSNAANQAALFKVRAIRYGSGNLTLRARWRGTGTTTSGSVVLGTQVAAYTPDTDPGSYAAKAFAAVATVTDAHLGTNADRIMTAAITVSAVDGLSPDDVLMLRLYRDSMNVADTINDVDIDVTELSLEYSDT